MLYYLNGEFQNRIKFEFKNKKGKKSLGLIGF